jgi:hypothetical protein
MKAACILFLVSLTVSLVVAQTELPNVVPSVTAAPIDESAVTILHLGPGYSSSVRLPEEIRSVVIGNPAAFKAEHSDSEPRLVFFKPITGQPSESNALITTKSGQEISLHLISEGKSAADAKVDFLLEYRRQQSLLIGPERQSFLIADTQPISTAPVISSSRTEKPDLIAQELGKQSAVSSPAWQGKEILVALGGCTQREQQTILGFSVFNNSKHAIELLPPQLELSGVEKRRKANSIKADPVPVFEYRLTARRLAVGQRTDGVVVFERPAFKESNERLQLRLAQAEQVDHPILLPLPFTTDQEAQ